ncbi:MAG TPA: hypothetical protein DEQ87_09500 [Algoriphagus sp.]|jgi:uncharacterized protein YjbI with pentapeptide repeats|uniref:Ion channel n=2 Tax=Algoriphagus TaxID=246875 RepID=A0A1H5UC72_9BACT|nr:MULTISPECIES: pentapeptide repeat-containing protein [Algoriphagus]MAL13685.1 hypothetical protein [Algoriphagus sp.]MCM0059591.1 ion channel [Algoriphagus sp.]MDP2041120.1 ion channel [Algoriphagus sp.]MDP3200857.1 ion channel [Algoriphagus sp.]MDP3474240.1 ion channel [Algoriphagus sp.]|tara:strand:- start:2513 stop:3694 length:1182 start_codon:yes stop_codon:yes gene_type:complete
MNRNQIQRILKKNGLQGDSLVDVWYSDHSKARDLLDRIIPGYGQKIEKQIRWETEPGIKALEIIKSKINILQKETAAQNSERVRSGDYQIEKTIIDFNQILIDGISISQFMYTNIPHTYSTGGWMDLLGIPLKWIRLQNCIIRNAQLSCGIFDNSEFYNVEFLNCNLNDCSFKNCRIGFIRFGDQSGSFTNADLNNAFVNAIDFSSKMWGGAKINEISYFGLLKISIFGENSFSKYNNYTSFSACNVSVDSEQEPYKELSEYVIWFQNTISKFSKISSEPRIFPRELHRMKNVLLAFSTKNWSSISAIFFSAALIVLTFSFSFLFLKENFLNISSFGDSINFSVQIFTGLGYADIKPDLTKGSLGNTIVSIENIVGYIWISLTLVVIGRKILK